MVADPRRGDGRAGHPVGVLHHRGDRDPRGAAQVAVPVDRLLRPAHGAGRGDPAAPAGIRVAARLHGVGDIQRYNTRMEAIEYAIEHDDGQSLRALDKADVILLAPSRCGKTPTTMYLALQHGLFVANYPLVDEDLESTELPRPVQDLRDRCFGLMTTPARLSQVRQERRPNSRYASLEQCTLRAAPGRGDVPRAPHPVDQLLGEVGRGDVDRDPADPRRRRRRDTSDPAIDKPPSKEPNVRNVMVRRPRPGRPRAGRRQELLARRDGVATWPRPASGCRTASPPRPTPTAGSSATPGWRSRSAASWPDLDTDDVAAAGRGGAGRSARPWSQQPFPADLEADIRDGVRASSPAATTSCPSRCAPAPRPRTCPTPRSPASRRPSSTSGASTPS